MRRKQKESLAKDYGLREVLAANQIATQIEETCRQGVPDCRVVTVLDGPGRSIDLRVGSRSGTPGDQLWVRDLDVKSLRTTEAVHNLARMISVWIEPEARSTIHGEVEQAARR